MNKRKDREAGSTEMEITNRTLKRTHETTRGRWTTWKEISLYFFPRNAVRSIFNAPRSDNRSRRSGTDQASLQILNVARSIFSHVTDKYA